MSEAAEKYGVPATVVPQRQRKSYEKVFCMPDLPLYDAIILRIFENHYSKKKTEFEFDREELVAVAQKLGLKNPKTLAISSIPFDIENRCRTRSSPQRARALSGSLNPLDGRNIGSV